MELTDFFSSIDWKTIISSLVILGAVLIAVYKLLAKSFIKSIGEESAKLLFTKETTLIEETINKDTASLLTQLKATLPQKNIAFELDYSFYKTERAKSSIELYKKLAHLYEKADRLTDGIKIPESKHVGLRLHDSMDDGTPKALIGYISENNYNNLKSEFEQSFEEAEIYYRESKIFFPNSLNEQINSLITTIHENCEKYIYYFESKEQHISNDLEKLIEIVISIKENVISIKENVISKQSKLDEIMNSLKKNIEPKEDE